MEVVKRFISFYESDFGRGIILRESEYILNEMKEFNLIVDVGCGIGEFEKYLSKLIIIGLDISEEMIREALNRSKGMFIIGDVNYLMFRESTIEAMFSVATLEFLENYCRAIKEIHRALKRNGKMLAMILNPKSDYFNEEIKDPKDYFRKIKISGLEEIRKPISEFFTIIKEEYFLGIRNEQIFETSEERYASMYVIVGKRE
ncbi:MAG: methyltransferase domain-containing protein [Candidatus Bathyarchaeia archaeon]